MINLVYWWPSISTLATSQIWIVDILCAWRSIRYKILCWIVIPYYPSQLINRLDISLYIKVIATILRDHIGPISKIKVTLNLKWLVLILQAPSYSFISVYLHAF
jgi:hypothetical protein